MMPNNRQNAMIAASDLLNVQDDQKKLDLFEVRLVCI